MRHVRTVHELFAALGEPNRTRIVELLLQGACPVGEIAATLQMSQSSASKHLKTLKNVGLVAVQTDAQSRIYAVNPRALHSLDVWLTPFRKLWADRLDALEQHLDAQRSNRSTQLGLRPSTKRRRR